MENIEIQAASNLRDLAAQIALNFVGHAISSSDGSYELLIQVIYDAMLQVDREARGDEREACAQICDEIADRIFNKPTPDYLVARDCAIDIRARWESLLYQGVEMVFDKGDQR